MSNRPCAHRALKSITLTSSCTRSRGIRSSHRTRTKSCGTARKTSTGAGPPLGCPPGLLGPSKALTRP
eukprot:13503521-Alexandrium_andersonii.AAC.1